MTNKVSEIKSLLTECYMDMKRVKYDVDMSILPQETIVERQQQIMQATAEAIYLLFNGAAQTSAPAPVRHPCCVDFDAALFKEYDYAFCPFCGQSCKA
jgi:hypothetical protein